MDTEARVHELEKHVNRIYGGIAVLVALSGALFAIAQITFVKEAEFEKKALKVIEDNELKGEPGPSGKS